MLQIDSEAKAEFREEPDDSYPRLSFFVALLSMFVAVTFHRTIKGILLDISVAFVLPISAMLCQ